MSQPKSNEELMTEFDIQQRLFLAGKLHSTKWNVWFKDVLAQKDAEVLEAKKEYIKSVLLDFHKARLDKALGYDFFFKLSTDLDDLNTPKE